VAVTRGQALTGRVITAAATIMILVFLSFLLNHLCGRANWWLPGWLDRGLPTLRVEGDAGRATKVASVPPRPRDRGHPSAGDAVTRWR
jgi:RND superfamily putative drug exporter